MNGFADPLETDMVAHLTEREAAAKLKIAAGIIDPDKIPDVALDRLYEDLRKLNAVCATSEAIVNENRRAARVLPPIGHESLADVIRLQLAGIADDVREVLDAPEGAHGCAEPDPDENDSVLGTEGADPDDYDRAFGDCDSNREG